MVRTVKRINPIAKALAFLRKRKQIVAPKKGKGSYKRKKVISDYQKGE